jgi:hypothetical protein
MPRLAQTEFILSHCKKNYSNTLTTVSFEPILTVETVGENLQAKQAQGQAIYRQP